MRAGMSEGREKISRIKMAPPRQLSFNLPTHGGRRKGAGRRPATGRALVSHAARPAFGRVTPAHVTLRVADHVPNLRSSRRFARIRGCFLAARGRFGVRLVEFSVLSNHLHLVVEAENSEALSRAMQGLCIRIAKALNAVLARSGRIFADHYHSRLLRTPTELARAIRYVVGNASRHYGETGADRFSSRGPGNLMVLVAPLGWLLRLGWRRAAPGDRIEPAALRLTQVSGGLAGASRA
jgi:REP element-mobilizing transposase RayT